MAKFSALTYRCAPAWSVDLGAVIVAALEVASALVEKKAMTLDVSLDDSVGRVCGDPGRLQQVVSNLLTNAIKFTPPHGRVTLCLDGADGRARLTVSDTGMGIDPAFLPDIFNRFTQENASTTRTYGGLGLGLAIVRHLVEAHGGTVKAESPGTGKGATITVMLPLMADLWEGLDVDVEAHAPAPSARRGGSPAVVVEDARLKDLRVLVVDDDAEQGETVGEILHRSGAKVRWAQSAAEAMTAVEELRPEVLVCDIAMPGEDGYSFLRRLRALGPARGGDVPAVALTALAGGEHRRAALAAGFQMHLSKPVEIEHLILAVVELSQRASS